MERTKSKLQFPALGISPTWGEVGGSRKHSAHDGIWEDVVFWSFLRRFDGTEVSFEAAVKELGLQVVATISRRRLWSDSDRPVAMDVIRGESWPSVNDQRVVGDLGYFANHELAVASHTVRYGQYIGPPEYFSCSEEVRLRHLPLANLRDGWYPAKVEDHFVVWGTGLRLCPKNLEWNLGLDPARGTANDGRGTRLYDSSPNRLERVRQFFHEAVGLAVSNPWVEYVRWANSYDPRGGRWRNHHQYPQPWEPHFPGWALSRFGGGVECCWKRPLAGAAHYYGLLQGKQPITVAERDDPPSAMVAAFKAAGLE